MTPGVQKRKAFGVFLRNNNMLKLILITPGNGLYTATLTWR